MQFKTLVVKKERDCLLPGVTDGLRSQLSSVLHVCLLQMEKGILPGSNVYQVTLSPIFWVSSWTQREALPANLKFNLYVSVTFILHYRLPA